MLEEKDAALQSLTQRLSLSTIEHDTLRIQLDAVISAASFTVRQMRAKVDMLRQEVQQELTSTVPHLVNEFASRLLERLKLENEMATKDLVAKYRFEVRQRKILYNKLQELRGMKQRVKLLLYGNYFIDPQ